MKNQKLLLLPLLVALNGMAADTALVMKKNAFLIEAGGKGPKYSLNFARTFRQGKKIIYSWRAGFSLLRQDLSLPLAVTGFTQGKQHHLEFSLGLTPYLKGYKTFLHKNDLSDKQVYITPGIGYRYQKTGSDFFVSAGFDPLIFMDPPSDHFWNFTPEFKPTGHFACGFIF